MPRNAVVVQRFTLMVAIALASIGVATAAFAQGAPRTPIAAATTTTGSAPTPVATLTQSATTPSGTPTTPATTVSTSTGQSQSPTPNAPPTGSGSAFGSRASDVWFFGGGLVAMLTVAVLGGWVAFGGRRR